MKSYSDLNDCPFGDGGSLGVLAAATIVESVSPVVAGLKQFVQSEGSRPSHGLETKERSESRKRETQRACGCRMREAAEAEGLYDSEGSAG